MQQCFPHPLSPYLTGCRSLTAAVPAMLQRDVLLASSTVRESLMISAQLKLPRSMSSREKMSRVENIIQELVRGWLGVGVAAYL